AILVEDRVGAEVDVGGGELLDQAAEDVGLDERGNLVAELELVEDLLDVGRETVKVSLEVGPELLLLGAGPQVAKRERRDVVERVAGGLAEGGMLVGYAGIVELLAEFEDGLLGRLEHGIEPADNGHG